MRVLLVGSPSDRARLRSQMNGSMEIVGEFATLAAAREADLEADAILLLLDRASIAASSGSACAAGSMEPSHVLRAMKLPFGYLRGAVRFSLSRDNREQDVDCVLDVLPKLVSDLQALSVPKEVACD